MSYKNSASLLKTAIILLFILLNLFIPAQRFSSGDVNPPVDKGNSWWNTTAGSNWVINTTGNIWVNKNISVGNSLEIANGGNLLFQNCTVIINNNLTVDYNATLILINTTILFNCSINGSSKFTVKRGGSLNISDFDNDSKTSHDASIINSKVSDNKHRYIFIISKGANFTMLNSELHQCGFSFAPTYYGLYIKADNSTLENNSFSMNYGGLIIESSNNSIKNNKVFNNDEYGLLIIMGKNNTLQNNTLVNNKYNFGLFLNDLNQDNNITLDNEINGKDICYTEKTENLTIDSVFSNAGFIGIVNSSNISVKDQYLNKNFNSLLLFSVNDIIFKNTSISHNYYGLFANNAQNIIFEDSNITNNSQIGFELFNFCQDFKIIGCNFKNNFIGIQVSNSNLTLINTTFFNSSNNDIFLRTTSEVNAINCSFNKNKIKFGSGISTFITKYYLNVQTKNHTGHSIGNVPISIYDGKDKLVYFGKSNNKGYLNWIPCVSYILKKTGINLDMSEHKIVVNYAGLEFVKYVNITQFSKTILFLNHPPKILNHPSKLVYINEDTKFYYDFEGYDIDFDNISWKSVTNASWINNINQTTGLIYGTPSDPDIGIFYLNISCNDNYSGYDYYNFTIVVNNTNDCPKIISKEGSGIAYEDILYIHDFNVTDPDRGDSHNWSMITDADWLLPIHKYLGKIIGRPSQDDVGKYYVNITCTDRLGSFDYYNYTLTVLAMNDRPVIINPPDRSLRGQLRYNCNNQKNLIYLCR